MSKENIEKLPKWAQQTISKMEANIVYWKKKALAAAGEEGETNTKLYLHNHEPGLPPDSIILFKLSNGNAHVRVKDGNLYLYFPSGYPTIIPDSSNTFYVEMKPEFQG
jgi:hypothetical protein